MAGVSSAASGHYGTSTFIDVMQQLSVVSNWCVERSAGDVPAFHVGDPRGPLLLGRAEHATFLAAR